LNCSMIDGNNQDVFSWLGYIAQALAILGIFVSSFLAYIKFVIERGLFPPAEFTVEPSRVGRQKNQIILEIQPKIENKGSSVLIVRNLKVNIRYLRSEDEIRFCKDHVGRVDFLRSLEDDYYSEIKPGNNKFFRSGGIPVLDFDTFVRPGVKQVYSMNTCLPSDTSFLLIRAKFDYGMKYTSLQRFTLSLAKKLGLINYTLDSINKSHSCERLFGLGENTKNCIEDEFSKSPQ
jgi:hypothetical protein